jgi:hypothetical protein
MAKKGRLSEVGVQIGSTLGKADRRAHKIAEEAKEELQAISKQIDVLKKQLAKSTKRLKKNLS